MGTLIDLTGQKFGRWTVLKRAEKRGKAGQVYWLCQCDCGSQKEVPGKSLRYGESKSCGCLQKEIVAKKSFKDITGQKFGKLTALYITGEKSGQNYIWHCKCDCGNECNVREGDLANGHTSSCGCLTRSLGEENIIKILQDNNIFFEEQKTFSDCRYPISNQLVKFDFYLPNNNRLIEFDGIQHFQANGGWNSKENHNIVLERDKFRNKWALEHNIPLVRIPYTERDNITLDMIIGDQYLVTSGDA